MKTLILDATTKTITAELTGAPATTNPDVVVSFADYNTTTLTHGEQDSALNGITPVTIVSAPAVSTQRIINGISIQNRDTAPVTLIVKYNNNSTLRQIAKVTLAVNDEWTTDGTFDSSGSLKTTNTFPSGTQVDGQAIVSGSNVTVIAPGTHAATSKATPVDADEIPLADSAASNVLKKLTWANLKTTFNAAYPAFRAYLTANETTIATGVETLIGTTAGWTKTGTGNFDTNNNFDNASSAGHGRFTPTIAGKYVAVLFFQGSTDGTNEHYIDANIRLNGTAFAQMRHHQGAGWVAYDTKLCVVSPPTSMNGITDYFDVSVTQNSGSNKTIYGTATIFSAFRVMG